ncbi:hypothetical protein [Sphingomonas sp. VDB2]|uniref:hypothetical protein n=1 Tax=Sphingomonas sp. VDB2 TaxID=3228751 RepID=UPI003A7FCD95
MTKRLAPRALSAKTFSASADCFFSRLGITLRLRRGICDVLGLTQAGNATLAYKRSVSAPLHNPERQMRRPGAAREAGQIVLGPFPHKHEAGQDGHWHLDLSACLTHDELASLPRRRAAHYAPRRPGLEALDREHV